MLMEKRLLGVAIVVLLIVGAVAAYFTLRDNEASELSLEQKYSLETTSGSLSQIKIDAYAIVTDENKSKEEKQAALDFYVSFCERDHDNECLADALNAARGNSLSEDKILSAVNKVNPVSTDGSQDIAPSFGN